MYTREHMEQMIWDYIDGLSTPAEKTMVEQLLHTDARWQELFQELSQVNRQIRESDWTDQPSMRFTQNVMDEVAKYAVARPTTSYVNKKVIYGISAFFLLSIIILLGVALSQVDYSSGSSKNSLGIDLSKWSFNPSALVNSTMMYFFMFFGVVAGLALLDRYLGNSKFKSQK